MLTASNNNEPWAFYLLSIYIFYFNFLLLHNWLPTRLSSIIYHSVPWSLVDADKCLYYSNYLQNSFQSKIHFFLNKNPENSKTHFSDRIDWWRLSGERGVNVCESQKYLSRLLSSRSSLKRIMQCSVALSSGDEKITNHRSDCGLNDEKEKTFEKSRCWVRWKNLST